MTDKEYLEEMIELTIKLTDACNNFGFRSDAYNVVLKKIAVSAARFNRSRRRLACFTKAGIFLLLCVLAWGFYMILHRLRI